MFLFSCMFVWQIEFAFCTRICRHRVRWYDDTFKCDNFSIKNSKCKNCHHNNNNNQQFIYIWKCYQSTSMPLLFCWFFFAHWMWMNFEMNSLCAIKHKERIKIRKKENRIKIKYNKYKWWPLMTESYLCA